MAKMKEFLNKTKEKAADAVDKAKKYDYKSAAENLKEKTADAAQKAKEYDYKGAAADMKDKAVDVAQKAKEYDYKEGVEKIKNNKGKIKKYLIIAIIIIAVIAIVTGVFKIRKAMNLTPEDAIDNYFSAIEKNADLMSDLSDGDDKTSAEILKVISDKVDYKILSVDEDDTSATAIIEVKAMDMESAQKAVQHALIDTEDSSEEEQQKAIVKAVKNTKDKVEETVTVELEKEGNKWVLSSYGELNSILFGE